MVPQNEELVLLLFRAVSSLSLVEWGKSEIQTAADHYDRGIMEGGWKARRVDSREHAPVNVRGPVYAYVVSLAVVT